jgi:hypothetical protein
VRSRRAYALVLVLLLALFAAALVTILLTRRGTASTAVQQQSDAYVAHHIQAGLREFIPIVLQATQRSERTTLAQGLIGFDLDFQQDLKMEVRLKDLGGAVLMSPDAVTSVRLGVMARAGLDLQQRGLAGLDYLRVFGPPRVSLHGASPEVLSALARAVDSNADGEAFARAVIDLRTEKNINPADVRTLVTKARVAGPRLELLEALVAAEPSYWWVEARVVDSQGREVLRQGGFASGALSPGFGTSAGAWVIEFWTALPRNRPFAAALEGNAQRASAAPARP